MKSPRMKMTLAVIGGLLITAPWYSYFEFRAATASVHMAAEDLKECRRLADEISRLSELPQLAGLQADSNETIADRINEAVSQSQLPDEALVRIQPQTDYRLGNSDYRVWPTRLELRQVTLQQATTFATRVVDDAGGLTIRDIRLWNPAGDSVSAGTECWSAEFTLTQLTFSPKTR